MKLIMNLLVPVSNRSTSKKCLPAKQFCCKSIVFCNHESMTRQLLSHIGVLPVGSLIFCCWFCAHSVSKCLTTIYAWLGRAKDINCHFLTLPSIAISLSTKFALPPQTTAAADKTILPKLICSLGTLLCNQYLFLFYSFVYTILSLSLSLTLLCTRCPYDII